MADYYPLIARAVSGLDANATGESRRALYERARTALITQLRSVQPPLSESEITRERLALEEAIRKVESEAAQRARSESARGDSASRLKPGDALRASTRAKAAEVASQANAPLPTRRPDRDDGAAVTPEARPASSPRPPRVLKVEPPRDDSRLETPRPPRAPLGRPAGPVPPAGARPETDSGATPRSQSQRPASELPPGLRGLRDAVSEADELGQAATQANRSARRTYANVPSPSPEFDRIEPDLENRGAEPAGGYDYGESMAEAERYQPRPADRAPPPPPPRRVKTGRAFPVRTVIVVGVLMMLIGAAAVFGPQAYSSLRGLFKSTETAVVQAPPKEAGPPPKITDRVGQPGSSQTVAPVAQKVVLYDEDPSAPQGKQYVGTVVWRTEEVRGANGQMGDLAIRADIDIPERKMKMTLSFRRNNDQSLPASHTVELNFVLPPEFDGGGIANVPGILMKSNEQARGTPLAGLAVKVTDNFFLIGLSNVESDRVRNLQLLKERSWFDIPLVYTTQRRAIIAVEKGEPGERAFSDAFAAWGQ